MPKSGRSSRPHVIAVSGGRVAAAIGLFVAIAVLSSGPFVGAFRPQHLDASVEVDASVGSGGAGALPAEQEESGPFPKAGLLSVAASGRTGPVDPADDPAIWVHPTNPGLSVIIGSNKDDDGGLHVFDLSGAELQYVAGGQHNNVDVRYGFRLGGDLVDLVSVSDRNNDQIDIYTIDPDTRRLTQVGAIQAGVTVYGYAMYHDRATDRFYGFVARRNVEQYEFVDIGGGRVGGVLVRAWSLDRVVEGIVADDELGVVYVGEESQGIFKYGADPSDPTNTRETVDVVGSPTGLVQDVEGLAIYYRGDGLGYLLASSQGNDRFIVYRREGDNQYLGTFQVAGGPHGPARDTDGIDVTNMNLGPQYPQGLFMAQNNDDDFKMVGWEDIASALGLAIHTTGYDVRGDLDDACLEVTSVSVAPGTPTIEVGASVQLTAVPRDAGGQPVDCAVSWSSSNTAVATVSTTGLVTGVGAGQTASIRASSGSAIGTAALTVTASNNSAPAVDAGANLPSQEGASVAILATFSDADGADVHTATISWGDGSPPQAGTVVQAARTIAGSHVYANDGAFTVTVTVNDGRGGVASDTTQANIGNVPPTASAGGPYSGIAGVPIPFSGSAIDPGADVLTYQWDFDYDGVTFDAQATGRFPQRAYASAGTYTAAFRVGDDDAVSIATAQVVVAAQPQAILYFALEGGATLGGVSVTNEDIVAVGGTGFSLFFDGSDVGLGSAAIDAFSMVGPSEILLSFTASRSIAGVSGTVDDSDIVRFTATSLGPTTAGTFSMYFDASDVGLTTSGEDVDAVELLPDGRLVLSTEGSFSMPGVSGADADAFVFTPTSLGPSTAGTGAMYFDGSDVGLTTSSEDIDAVAIAASGRIHLSSRDGFSVAGVSGADEDVFVFTPTQLGSTTAGTFSSSLFFDGSARGVSGDIAAIDLP